MRRRSLGGRRSGALAACAILLCGSLAGGSLGVAAGSPSPVGSATVPLGVASLGTTDAVAAQVEDILSRMTLRQKVGQLFVSRVYGATVDDRSPAVVAANQKALKVDNAKELIERYHVGGIVYFRWTRSLRDPRQTARLSNGIQTVARAQDPGIPLFISTDEEGGIVTRLPSPSTAFPGAMALGATRSDALARDQGRVIGLELAAVGINQDLAPVADVNVDPDNPVIGLRSLGAGPAFVARLTAAQVLGLQEDAGVSATVKHFPGHGDTNVDSHTGLPVIDHSRAEWERLDAPPFQAAIDAGTDMIMTAHISVPALDPSGWPATLSRPIITGILREEMGFEGLIITDSLGMAGVRAQWSHEEIAVLALKAGVDMLVNPGRLRKAYNAVLRAVREGELSESRIDASVRRILTVKIRRGLFERPPVRPAEAASRMGIPAHRTIADRVAARSVTLVRDRADLVPSQLRGRRVLVTGYGVAAGKRLVIALKRQGATVTRRTTGQRPSDATIASAVRAAAGTHLVVVLLWNARGDVRQRRLVERLEAAGHRVITVATGNPYDIGWLSASRTHLLTYSLSAASMRGLARVIGGRIEARGRLPVAIPRLGGGTLYPIGHGLAD
ncbi:MAG: glycoside hydrolase family 3 protein [Chloroflexi bacterium]|nr:glycoside hydrolase family 3 protein [Chloroflexota bacterium]